MDGTLLHRYCDTYRCPGSYCSAGAPLTDLALNMLKRIEDHGLAVTKSHISYNAINSMGERLKSSTIPILGENDRVIGILCINMYLDSPFSEVLESITGTGAEPTEQEHFSVNTTDTIHQAIADALGISINTVYLHLRSLSGSNEGK